MELGFKAVCYIVVSDGSEAGDCGRKADLVVDDFFDTNFFWEQVRCVYRYRSVRCICFFFTR